MQIFHDYLVVCYFACTTETIWCFREITEDRCLNYKPADSQSVTQWSMPTCLPVALQFVLHSDSLS